MLDTPNHIIFSILQWIAFFRVVEGANPYRFVPRGNGYVARLHACSLTRLCREPPSQREPFRDVEAPSPTIRCVALHCAKEVCSVLEKLKKTAHKSRLFVAKKYYVGFIIIC